MSERAPTSGKPRRPYEPPAITEIVLDANEAMLTPCRPNVVTSPPCPPFNHSVLPQK